MELRNRCCVWMQGCKERHFSQDYISFLFAAGCDHFWAPLSPRPVDEVAADTAGNAAAASHSAASPTGTHQLLPAMAVAAHETAERCLSFHALYRDHHECKVMPGLPQELEIMKAAVL